jgi:hypothetical protein
LICVLSNLVIKDGVVVRCHVKEDAKTADSPPSATKFVPDLAKYTIEDYTAASRPIKRGRSASQASALVLESAGPGGPAALAEGPLIRVQEPPQAYSHVGVTSMIDDDEYFDFDDRVSRSSTVEAVSGGVPMQLLSIGYSEFMKYWTKLWKARSGIQ